MRDDNRSRWLHFTEVRVARITLRVSTVGWGEYAESQHDPVYTVVGVSHSPQPTVLRRTRHDSTAEEVECHLREGLRGEIRWLRGYAPLPLLN